MTSKGKLKKRKGTMLEYTKTILKKVSFDLKLFKKELYKSVKYLTDLELKDLEEWVFQNYGLRYQLIEIK